MSNKKKDDENGSTIFKKIGTATSFFIKIITSSNIRSILKILNTRIDSILSVYNDDKLLIKAFKRQKTKNRVLSVLSLTPVILFSYSFWLFISNNPLFYKYFARVGTNLYNLSLILYKKSGDVKFTEALIKRVFEVDGVDFAVMVSFSLVVISLLVLSFAIEKIIVRNHVMISETMRVIPLVTYFNLDKEGTPEFKKEKDKHWYIFKNKTILFCHAGLLIDVDSSDIDSVLTDKHIWTQTSTYPIKSFQNSDNRHLGFILIGSPLADLYPMFANIKVPPKGTPLKMK